MTLAEAERAMLAEASAAARMVRSRLTESIGLAGMTFPLSAEALATLERPQRLEVESLLLQFMNLTAIVQDQLARSILYAEGIDVSGQTRKDQHNTLEKFGAWPPGFDFREVARARNSLAHQYPHDPERQVVIVNDVVAAIPLALAALDAELDYVARRYPDLAG